MNSTPCQEQSIELETKWSCQFVSSPLEQRKKLILLLHGYQQSGQEIFNTVYQTLPSDFGVIAPNGPFPIPVKNAEFWSLNFAWYFFDRQTMTYHVPISFAVEVLQQFIDRLLKRHGLNDIPITIVGYSQGGYVAPFLADTLEKCDHAIMIGSRIRNEIIDKPINAHITAIHGIKDPIVEYERSKNSFDAVKALGQKGEWISSPSRHSIDEGILHALGEVLARQ